MWSKPLLRRFTLPRPGYRHGTPKYSTLPTGYTRILLNLSDVAKHIIKKMLPHLQETFKGK